jgi:hypothetical protein
MREPPRGAIAVERVENEGSRHTSRVESMLRISGQSCKSAALLGG